MRAIVSQLSQSQGKKENSPEAPSVNSEKKKNSVQGKELPTLGKALWQGQKSSCHGPPCSSSASPPGTLVSKAGDAHQLPCSRTEAWEQDRATKSLQERLGGRFSERVAPELGDEGGRGARQSEGQIPRKKQKQHRPTCLVKPGDQERKQERRYENYTLKVVRDLDSRLVILSNSH